MPARKSPSRVPKNLDAQSVDSTIDIRFIDPASAEYRLALHLALDAPPLPGSAMAPAVCDLLATVERGMAGIDLLFGAFEHDELIQAALAIESPGRAALISLPNELSTEAQYRATCELLGTLQQEAWKRSIILLEILTIPPSLRLGEALQAAGFRSLTHLNYLRRSAMARPHRRTVDRDDLDWVTFSADHQSLFETALERTYLQSMDCPELTAVRRTSDVLAGHQAAGVFDPNLWWVACHRGEPLGVMLLNRFADGFGTEIVYMGVAQGSRGLGIGDALLQRACDATRKVKAQVIALAVDARNSAARLMYKRWGFREMAVREAWIACYPQ